MIAFCLKNDLKELTDREVNEQFTAAVTYVRQKMKRGQAVKSKQRTVSKTGELWHDYAIPEKKHFFDMFSENL